MEEGTNEAIELGELMCVGDWRLGTSEAEHSKGHPLEGRARGAGSSPFCPLK